MNSCIHKAALRIFIIIGMTLVQAMPATASNDIKTTALYSIELTGFEIGKINYILQTSKTNYTSRASVDISVLASLFKWRVDATTSGKLKVHETMKPDLFEYKTRGSKKQHVNIIFPKAKDEKLSVTPSLESSEKRVPVKAEHLKHTFDPLTAIASLTQFRRTQSRNICNRQIPVFDGKTRYDIKLSFKKAVIIDIGKKGRRSAYICKLRYQPISGYKVDGRAHTFLAKASDIEIWLLPLPKIKKYVLYKMRIPTPLGIAQVRTNQFLFEEPGTSLKFLGRNPGGL